MIKQYLNTFRKLFTRPEKIYIAGPVTGLEPDYVVASFALAEAEIRDSGNTPVNPKRFIKPDENWNEAMNICINRLVKCDSIYMLKGWEESDGAMVELFIALVTNKGVYFEDGNAPETISFSRLLSIALLYLPGFDVKQL